MSEHDVTEAGGGVDMASGMTGTRAAPRALTDAELAKLAELDEAIAKFEAQKRWSDVIKSILVKAAIHQDPAQKVELFTLAGNLYLEKSSNQAEAIKAFEAVLELEPHNVEAIARLKEMYEKRRDWEKLVHVMKAEAELLDESDRALRYVEMAQLATEKLRKPEVCIDLWNKVLAFDAENAEALAALAGLYERAREWGALAAVLEKQVQRIGDEKELAAALNKLGMIYADKLNDDAGAVSAFRRLLALDPNDRRAQEQLKKRYAALKAWDDLEAFYETQDNKWDELIRTYEREAENKDATDAERIDLLFRIARLWAEKKEKTDRAARAYEKVLELDPRNERAAIALSPIYQASGDAKKLAGVYEVRLAHLSDPEERVTLLRELGLLYEEKLRDPVTAFERYLAAFAIDPMRDVVRADVQRAAAATGGWDRLVAHYEAAIDQASPADALALRLSFGKVLSSIGRTEEAIAQIKTVWDARSDDTDTMQALEELYRATGKFRELHAVYTRRAELESDPEARRALAYAMAALYENELQSPGEAVDAYRAILAEYGDEEQDAWRALDRLYEALGRWRDYAEALERRIDLASDEQELASLKFRLAHALDRHLDDKARALDLYREILSLMPEHDGARVALEALMPHPTLGASAAEILEPIYEVRGDWENLLRAIDVLHDAATEPERRLELLTKAGEVCQHQIGDAGRAFDTFARALRDNPASMETLARLEALAGEIGRWKDVVQLLVSLAGSVEDADLGRALWIRAAQVDDAMLGDVDGAVSAYGRVLAQNPADEEVLAALDELYRRTERWRDLLGVLRRKVELASDPGVQEALLAESAEILDQRLGDPQAAISVYREILELDPASTRALSALDGLLERLELWSDLADNVGRQLAIADDPDQQVALMLRLASLRETRMGDVEAAIDIYRQVLHRDPSRPEAIEALERLMQNPALQVAIAEILEPIYRDSNQFQKLIGVHEIQVRHASSPEHRIELLGRIAELYEVALDDLGSAFASFARALSEDPSQAATQENLERLARASGNYEALAQVYEREADKLAVGEGAEHAGLAAALLMKAAQVREEQFGDVHTAIAHYQRVLALDPNNLDAATALERLFQLAERYEDLADVYLVKARMLETPEEQKAYLFRAASIHEDVLDRPTEAVAVYQQVLEIDPEDLAALDKLIELHLKLSQWEPLLSVYSRKADIVADADEKKALLVEVGAVYERELADYAKAIDAYQRILEIDPDDMTAIGRLDVLYQATGNWQELLQVLEREAELARDPGEVISYRYRIADLWHHKLGDASRAVEGYREILEVAPDHEPTLAALESMVSTGLEAVAAAGVLEPVYRAAGEWAKLVAVHEVQIAHETDPLRKVELLHAVAELYENALDEPERAFAAYARAVPLDSANEATLAAIERLAEQIGKWAEVTRLYDVEVEKLAGEGGDPVRLVEMATRLARIYEVRTGEVDRAIDRYRTVLATEDTNPVAIAALDRLYEATERWSDLAAILEIEARHADTPDDVLHFQYRLAQVQQVRLGNVSGAIDQYKEILAAAPEYQPALEALEALFAEGVEPLRIGEIIEPLYRMSEAWDRLIDVYTVQLGHIADPESRLEMIHRIAELAEERVNDHQLALEWELRALLEAPRDERANEQVDRLAEILDRWPLVANTLADVLERPGHDAEDRAFVGRRLATIYETRIGDIARAEEAYRYVLGVAPGDAEALEALDRIYSETGAHEALAETLRRRIALLSASDPRHPDLVELAYRLGQTYERDLQRPQEAIAAYLDVLDKYDPHHVESIAALAGIYTRLGDWPALFRTFEREVEVVGGDSARSDVYAKMARLQSDHIGDRERAIDLWQKVLDLRGEDAEALNALGDIYAAQQRWRDLVDILEREVNVVEDDAVRAAIYADLGRIWYERLGKERNALEAWERVLDIDPGQTDALFAIAHIHRAAGRHAELVDTLQRVIDVGSATLDDATLEAVYVELGTLFEKTLRQPADAVDAFGKALDLNPRNFDTLDALERIHSEQGNWEDAIAIKERRVQVLDDPSERIAELLAIAAAWDEKVGEKDRGSSAYQRILELDPLHRRAFDALEGLHREAGRAEDLIALYLSRVEATEDVAERVDLLRRAASVYERQLDDRNNAFETLQLAWSADYTDETTAAELERLAGLTQRWNELLTSANAALAEVTDRELKIAICLRCAKWYGTELKHPEYAIPYYQQILALDPANLPAMRQMAGLYRTTQQWPTLAQVLGRLVEMTTDPAEKQAVYVQIGELAENQLGHAALASDYYEKALAQPANDPEALESLESIFRSRQQWNDLLQVLRRKLGLATHTEERVRELLKIAEVFEDRLHDPDEAIATYRQVIDLDARNLQALKGLERLYTLKERWHELVGVLEGQLDVVETERERIAILTRLASMWEELFVKPEKAAERLEQVIEIDPNHEPSLRSLARLYRQMQRWDDLVGTLERHVSATPERKEKVELYRAIGEVWATEKNDADRAIDAYLELIAIDEGDVRALDALARLYERRGDYSQALDVMEQLSRRISDPRQLVELRYRMGRLYDEKLGDRATAVEKYESAIDVEPGHLPSLEAMRKIQLDNGDWLSAAKTLEQEVQHTQNARQKAKLYVELGRLYADRLDEPQRAIQAFEAAHGLDADNEDAALPLVDEYMRQERHADALPLVDMLVKRAGKRPPEEQHKLWFQYGTAAAATGDDERALKGFANAHQLDPHHLPSLQGLAAAHYRLKDWEKAFKFYQMILVHHRDALGKEAVTDTFFRLGVIKREQKERRKALNMFDKALEEDAFHRPTLEAVIALYAEGNEWEQVIHFKKQLLEISSEQEQFKLLDEIGDLWKEKLKNPQKAIASWEDALVIQPKNHVVLHKLLGAFQEQRLWDRAIEVIQRIAELDERPSAKAKYAYTIGVIFRDELKNAEQAVAKFDEALDLDPSQLKPFEAINKIWTTQKDWRQLERAFRKMLKRVVGKGNTDLEWNLWHNLGVIYRDRQQKYESAAEAFKMASNLKPEDRNGHQILAELYALIPSRVSDAIEEHQWLLRNDPFRVDSYRALYKLYFDARAYDKAWCVASTLVFLKKADAEQTQFVEQYKNRGIIRPSSPLDNERFVKDLFHPDADLYIGKLFETITPAVLALKAQPDKNLGLVKKEQIDFATTTVTFAKTFQFVSQVLSLPLPRLFLKPSQPGGLLHAPADPVASVSGSALLSGFNPQDLTFVIAHHLAYYRGEHYLMKLLPTQNELKMALVSALRLVGLAPSSPEIDASAANLQARMQPVQLEALRVVAKRFVEAGGRSDIKRWMQAVELTACRAGFLVCNDLEIAARMIQSLPSAGPQDLPPKDKITELVLFSVSEQYFRLREALGITIQIG